MPVSKPSKQKKKRGDEAEDFSRDANFNICCVNIRYGCVLCIGVSAAAAAKPKRKVHVLLDLPPKRVGVGNEMQSQSVFVQIFSEAF